MKLVYLFLTGKNKELLNKFLPFLCDLPEMDLSGVRIMDYVLPEWTLTLQMLGNPLGILVISKIQNFTRIFDNVPNTSVAYPVSLCFIFM